MKVIPDLNPQQRLAVETVHGRVLVLAGAGSGKTRVLTLRMAHLINHLSCPPEAILGLTFTNKAAAEMRHRLAGWVDPKLSKRVTLCTFHSFCMQLLRTEIHQLGYTADFTLYDEKDMLRLCNAISREILEREGGEIPSLQATMEAIAQAKGRGLKSEEIQGTGSSWHDGFAQEMHKRLACSLRAYNAVDFDSLLSLTVELFETHPRVLDKYQERYRYLMIDEYQDTNPIQYRLATLLSKKYNNLCVVGDDDQSIYGWRGADIHNILDFREAIVVKLEQNYRSTNTILGAANAVIANNHKRHGKSLWSTSGEGELIEVFHAPSEIEEAEAVVCRIASIRQRLRLNWKDIAILYRSNALSRTIEQALLKYRWMEGKEWRQGIPYQIHGGTEFYERREVKDLVAYLRVIVNPKDQESILRVVNYPRRGIGETSLDALTAYNRVNGLSLWNVLESVAEEKDCDELLNNLSDKALKGIRDFIEVIRIGKEKFAALPLSEAMHWFIERIKFKKAIDEEVKSGKMQEFKWENVQEFISSLAEYEARGTSESRSDGERLVDFVQQLPLAEDWGASKANKKGEDAVNLMTFHSAKGLEFPVCFLIGLEDHIIPHEKSLKQTGVEEERRLMYVAMTRARSHLTLSMARKRKRMGIEAASTPSRFILEVPQNYLKVVKWDQIG